MLELLGIVTLVPAVLAFIVALSQPVVPNRGPMGFCRRHRPGISSLKATQEATFSSARGVTAIPLTVALLCWTLDRIGELKGGANGGWSCLHAPREIRQSRWFPGSTRCSC